MQIILDPEESLKWLHMLQCEKTLEETSRFFPGFKCSAEERHEMESAKVKIANWPSHHRAEIMAMVADGKYPREIASELGMKECSVKHLVYGEKKKARLAFHVEDHGKPKSEEPIQKVVIPMGKAESPAKEPTTRQDRIDAIIVNGSQIGINHTSIAASINNQLGCQWLPDDVSKRLAELRGEL